MPERLPVLPYRWVTLVATPHVTLRWSLLLPSFVDRVLELDSFEYPSFCDSLEFDYLQRRFFVGFVPPLHSETVFAFEFLYSLGTGFVGRIKGVRDAFCSSC